MNRAAKTPPLRFAGCEGEWEEKGFDAVFAHISAKEFQVATTDYREQGLFPIVDQGKGLVAGHCDRRDKVFKAAGNPVIVFGDHTREVKFVDFDFVVGADGTQLLRTPGNDVGFLARVVEATELPNMGYSRHFKLLQEATFRLPADLSEQRKVGVVFRQLDALIAGREKALGKLEALKKAMLLKMFPREGATVPEVRFKGFEGEWEEKTFDEVFIHVPSKNYQIQTADYRDSGLYPIVDQGKKMITGYCDRGNKVFSAHGNPVIVFGDHTREVKYVDFDFVVGADGTQLLRTQGNDIRFLATVVEATPLPNMGYSRHFKYLQETVFYLPSFPEQRKIAILFRSLDATIAGRRKEVEKLKQLKKGLLERMFA